MKINRHPVRDSGHYPSFLESVQWTLAITFNGEFSQSYPKSSVRKSAKSIEGAVTPATIVPSKSISLWRGRPGG